ncbi:MAG: 3-hydroxyacyl-CoA dehydrogenase, partial [Actinobacteria bacterium]|nr:3-hydroxyacyl-CoA dehydrogenase [Actinomycetota bacterium]
MSTSTLTPPPGAPEEVVTKSLLREVDLTAFGFNGKLALITLDNGQDFNRPNTLGPQTLHELGEAIRAAEALDVAGIAITGKPFIFAA